MQSALEGLLRTVGLLLSQMEALEPVPWMCVCVCVFIYGYASFNTVSVKSAKNSSHCFWIIFNGLAFVNDPSIRLETHGESKG